MALIVAFAQPGSRERNKPSDLTDAGLPSFAGDFDPAASYRQNADCWEFRGAVPC